MSKEIVPRPNDMGEMVDEWDSSGNGEVLVNESQGLICFVFVLLTISMEQILQAFCQ